jgi:S-formylglutathione hydrolase FrmB
MWAWWIVPSSVDSEVPGVTRTQLKELSLMHCWLPVLLAAAALFAVIVAVWWRTRQWRTVWIPLSAAAGVIAATAVRWYLGSAGIMGDSPPLSLWVWVGVLGGACVVSIAGWRASPWWRRGVSLLALPLVMACVAVTVNGWVGYFPTVGAAWTELTTGPLPDQTDRAGVTVMQLSGDVPAKGVLISVAIDSAASHFKHRNELVYVPPAWFASVPPPALPTVMMIGGEFNTPTDWVRAGDAVTTVDMFAAAHGGHVPVLVFVDSGGGFNTDTECVNGSRGNAADHLTKDVIPFMASSFGVSRDPARWGVVGFSAGGTCAIDLTVMHPELFHTFGDIPATWAPIRAAPRKPSTGCSAAASPHGNRSIRAPSSPDTATTTAFQVYSSSPAPGGTTRTGSSGRMRSSEIQPPNSVTLLGRAGSAVT